MLELEAFELIKDVLLAVELPDRRRGRRRTTVGIGSEPGTNRP